jgi:hypothetical protein
MLKNLRDRLSGLSWRGNKIAQAVNRRLYIVRRCFHANHAASPTAYRAFFVERPDDE